MVTIAPKRAATPWHTALRLALTLLLALTAGLKLIWPPLPSQSAWISPGEGRVAAIVELTIAMGLWVRHRSAWPILAAITLSTAFAIAFLILPDTDRPCGCYGRLHVGRTTHGVIVGAMGLLALLLHAVAGTSRR